MSDVIEKTSNVINDARTKAIASVRSYAQPKIISATIEMVVAIVMIMGVQLIIFKFDISALLHWKFWARTGLLSIGIFALYRAVINARFPKTENRQSVIDIKERYVTMLKIKSLQMKDWLKDVFNVKTKTEAWVDKWNHKIYKLENKIARTYNPKKREKYETKIEKYKEFTTTEYIVKHIDTIRIKYYIVYYSDFQDITLYGNGGIYTRGNYNKAFNTASFKKMWVYILTSALLGVSVMTLDTLNTFTILMSIGSTAFMCITRIVTALLEADQLYDKTITASLLGRIEVLDEWKKYQDEHPSKTIIETERQEMERVLREEIKKEYDKAYEDKLNVEKAIIRSECMKLLETNEVA